MSMIISSTANQTIDNFCCTGFLNSPLISMILTVISGVIIFVICEHVKEVIFLPKHEYKKLKGRIAFALTYYANVYGNVIDFADNNTDANAERFKVRDELRALASELHSTIENMPKIKSGFDSKENIRKASGCLIALSNCLFCAYNTHDIIFYCDRNLECADQIRKCLNLTRVEAEQR